jgi:hypothetical protein
MIVSDSRLGIFVFEKAVQICGCFLHSLSFGCMIRNRQSIARTDEQQAIAEKNASFLKAARNDDKNGPLPF